MSVSQTVTNKLSSLSDSLRGEAENDSMSEDERAALDDAERLANQFSDIKPEHLVISGNHLFAIPNEIQLFTVDKFGTEHSRS